MSRRRYISTDISTDPRINKLAMQGGDFAVMLYTWMIPHCADDATISGDPEELLMSVIPGRRDKSADDIAAALTVMESLGLIAWSRDEMIVTFPAQAFYKYQTYIPDGKRRGAHNTEDQQTTDDNSADQRKTPQKRAYPSPSPSVSPSPSPSPSTNNKGQPTVVAPQAPKTPPEGPKPEPPKPERPKSAAKIASEQLYERRMPIFEAFCRGLGIELESLAATQRKGPSLNALPPAILDTPECTPDIVEPLTRFAATKFKWREGRTTPSLAEALAALPEWEEAGRPDGPAPMNRAATPAKPAPRSDVDKAREKLAYLDNPDGWEHHDRQRYKGDAGREMLNRDRATCRAILAGEAA